MGKVGQDVLFDLPFFAIILFTIFIQVCFIRADGLKIYKRRFTTWFLLISQMLLLS